MPALAALTELNEREAVSTEQLKRGDDPIGALKVLLENQVTIIRALTAILAPPVIAASEQQRRVALPRIVPPNGGLRR